MGLLSPPGTVAFDIGAQEWYGGTMLINNHPTEFTSVEHNDWEAPSDWTKVRVDQDFYGNHREFYLWVSPDLCVRNRHHLVLDPEHYADMVLGAREAAGV